jgi:dTDP-L-rhamnose 4-epimerase
MPNPTSIYGVTKFAQEELLRVWCNSNEVSLINLRLQNVFGAGQSTLNPYTGILPLFVKQARAARPIELYEDGEITRDFIHVTDVGRALRLSLYKKMDAGEMKILDIGSGNKVSLKQIANMITDIHKSIMPEVSGRFRLGDVRHAYSNITEAQNFLNWTPLTSLESGLNDLCNQSNS